MVHILGGSVKLIFSPCQFIKHHFKLSIESFFHFSEYLLQLKKKENI